MGAVAKKEQLERVEADLARGHTHPALQRLANLIGRFPEDLDIRARRAAVNRQIGNPAEAGRWGFLTEVVTVDEVAAFERAVLRALEETENALVSYREDQARLVKLTEQARESARAAGIARIRYREGAVDFLDLLDAERSELLAEDAVAQSESAVFTSVVGLYKALGGIPAHVPAPVTP